MAPTRLYNYINKKKRKIHCLRKPRNTTFFRVEKPTRIFYYNILHNEKREKCLSALIPSHYKPNFHSTIDIGSTFIFSKSYITGTTDTRIASVGFRVSHHNV